MTEFTMRMSYACPVALVAAGNEFMAWNGWSLGDRDTFKDHTPFEDPDNPGEFYLLASGQYKPGWVDQMQIPVTEETRPEWGEDLDIVLAIDGQNALRLHEDETPPTPESVVLGADTYTYGTSIIVKVKGYGELFAGPTGGAIINGPYLTYGQTYWIGNTTSGNEFFVSLDYDPVTEEGFWVPIEDPNTMRLRVPQRRAIRRQARTLGWTP